MRVERNYLKFPEFDRAADSNAPTAQNKDQLFWRQVTQLINCSKPGWCIPEKISNTVVSSSASITGRLVTHCSVTLFSKS